MKSIVRGTRPRSRVGLVGIFLEEENNHFDRLFPTIWRAPTIEELQSQVQPNELDLIIISRKLPESGTRFSNYFDQVHVICFSEEIGNLPGPFENTDLKISGKSKNEEIELPQLPLLFERRRGADIAQVSDIKGWFYIGVSFSYGRKSGDAKMVEELIKRSAIIIDRYEQIPLAVIFKREQTGLGTALLPNPVFDQMKWVELIVSDWAQSDRESFPDFGDWTKNPKWMVPEEEEIIDSINNLEKEKRETIQKFDLEIAELQSDLSLAMLNANKGLRNMITAQGDELVSEIVNVFENFGFEVEEIDETIDPKLPKREDLRLRDPSVDEDWEAIVEVRGYSRSAGKTRDLQRISRFATFYHDEKDRMPDKRIYVVNGQIELIPNQRQDVLASAEEDIRDFSEDNGLIISSLDLFRAIKMLNQFGKDKIKESIKNTVGRWSLESIED